MKSNSLKVWLGVAVTALVVSGCNCSSDPCEKVAVKFDSPMDGASVDTPLDVSAQMVDKNGAALKVDSSSIQTKLKDGTFGMTTAGTNAADKATFSGVNLESSCATPPCQNVIHVELSHNPGGDKNVCIAKGDITVTVNANNNPPTVACGGFPQDTNHDGVINSSELAMGADLKVTANTTNTIMGGTVTVSEGTNVLATQMPTMSNLDLQIPSASVADGMHSYTVKATKNGQSATATCSIDVERTPKTSCSISTPSKTSGMCGTVTVLGSKADANGTKTGFQLAVIASVNSSATNTKITVSGGATLDSGALTATNSQVSTVFDLPATGTTAYTITETSTDSNGNSCTDSVDVSVDYDAPTVALNSPTMAGSPYANFMTDFAATVTDTNSNCGKVFFSTSLSTAENKYFPAVPVSGSMTPAGLKENLFQGQQTVTARAVDAAGNEGSTTQTVTVNASTGCSIEFTSSPLDKANAVIQSSDLDGTGNYHAAVKATPNCANATLTVDITPDTATCPAAGQAQSLMTTLDGSGLGTVSFPVVDGCYIIKATVGSDVLSTPFTVVKDAPAITSPAQQTPYTLLNIANDGDAAPGWQGTLALLTTIPNGAFVDICTDSMDPALIGATPTPCPGNPTLNVLVGGANITQTSTSGFTFPDPATEDVPYNIYAVLVLPGGTTLTSNPVLILVDTIAPSVTSATVDGAVNNVLNIAGLNGATHPSVTVSISGPPADIATVRIRDTAGGNPDNSVQTYGATPTDYVLDSLTTPLEATFNFTVSVRDVAQNQTLVTIPATLIDSVAPTCAISTPSNNAVLNIAGDASSTTAGWQLAPQVTTSADAQTVDVTTVPASAQVTAASAGNAWTALLTVPTAMGMVGSFTVKATCTDLAGNPNTSTDVTGVTVDLDPPTCAFVTPTSNSTTTSFINTTTINTTGVADGQSVSLSVTNSSGTTNLTSLTVSSGVATGSESYPAGTDTVNGSVVDSAGNPGTCSVTNYQVSGTGCDLTVTSPVPNGLGHLFATNTNFNVVAHTSCSAGKTVTVTNVGTGTLLNSATTMTVSGGSDATVALTLPQATYSLKVEIDDGTGIKTAVTISVTVDTTGPTFGTVSPTGANLFFVAASNVNLPNAAYIVDKAAGAPADFDVVITTLAGADNGKVELVLNGTPVQTTSVTGNSIPTLTIPSTLAQKASGTLVIRVKDEAGNATVMSTSTIQVDVVPPGAVTLTQSIANPRTATASLSWPAVYDDGTDNTSGAASFDVRWSTGIAGGTTCAQYFDGTRFFKQGDVSGTSTMLQPLPPMNTYDIIVRAHDPIGNYSACTNPTPLPNPGTQDVLTNPSGTAGQYFGTVLAANGSVDGDAIDDLVVGVPAIDTVYVYYGNAAFGTSATCNSTTHCQAITGTAGDYFGQDVAVGNVGDTTAPDLIVGASAALSGQGRVFIFFGGANPLVTTSPIEIDGDAADPTYGFGVGLKVLPSIDSDTIGELMITSPYANGGQGKVYIFKGRSKAQWQALGNPVPISAADWTIVGPTPVDMGGSPFNFFASNTTGIGSVGDITGDGKPDFIITDPKDDLNRVYQFSGAAVASASAPITTGDGATPDQSLKRLTYGALLSGNNFNSFGVSMTGGLNMTGGTGPDLAVGNAHSQQVYVFADAAATGWSGSPALTISGLNLAFGNLVTAGDFDADGTPDLLIADNSAASNVWLFFHRATGNDYDPTAGSGFRQSVLPGNTIGVAVGIGDFDGNGKVDFAAGDDGNSPGKVTVWHP